MLLTHTLLLAIFSACNLVQTETPCIPILSKCAANEVCCNFGNFPKTKCPPQGLCTCGFSQNYFGFSCQNDQDCCSYKCNSSRLCSQGEEGDLCKDGSNCKTNFCRKKADERIGYCFRDACTEWRLPKTAGDNCCPFGGNRRGFGLSADNSVCKCAMRGNSASKANMCCSDKFEPNSNGVCSASQLGYMCVSDVDCLLGLTCESTLVPKAKICRKCNRQNLEDLHNNVTFCLKSILATRKRVEASERIDSNLEELQLSNFSLFNEWGPSEPDSVEQFQNFLRQIDYADEDQPKQIEDEPTNVIVSVYIQKISAVSESSSSYKIQMFVNMAWLDPRLKAVGNNKTAANDYFQLSSVGDQKSVWTPPIFFPNVEVADQPDIFSSNSVLFLFSEGLVTFRFRVICVADCEMNLRKFPFDKQRCPLLISVFGFFDSQVKLHWGTPIAMRPPNAPTGEAVEITKKIKIAGWKFYNFSASEYQDETNWKAVCGKEKTCLKLTFELSRTLDYYIIDTYIPTGIIMTIASTSLWLGPENMSPRLALGLTSFVTIVFQTIGIRSKLPSVSYTKALDVWVLFAQLYIFCIMAESVVINGILLGKFKTWQKATHLLNKTRITAVTKFRQKIKRSKEGEKEIQQDIAKAKEGIELSLQMDKFARYLFPTTAVTFAAIYFIHFTL